MKNSVWGGFALKAVILAGGQGTRLRPVTGDLPKPLVPLLGRPLLEHILLLLKREGFTQVCAALSYRAEEIITRFGDGSSLGLHLEYRVEEQALGTAGAVKHCADFAAGEDLLVISGDAACDFALSRLMAQLRESRAAAVLALYRHPQPLRYGLAVTEADGRIRSFIEKPSWGRVVTDLVNTGIYALSPAVLEQIPEGEPCDFAGDLFPALLKQDVPLLGLPMKGYWCDVGTPLSYYRCCVDALEGRLRLSPAPSFLPKSGTCEEPEFQGAAQLDCPCHSRAALMGALSACMLELNADYSDGIRLDRPGYRLHIAPLAAREAIRIAVDAPDAEFARELALSARELAEALDAQPPE